MRLHNDHTRHRPQAAHWPLALNLIVSITRPADGYIQEITSNKHSTDIYIYMGAANVRLLNSIQRVFVNK